MENSSSDIQCVQNLSVIYQLILLYSPEENVLLPHNSSSQRSLNINSYRKFCVYQSRTLTKLSFASKHYHFIYHKFIFGDYAFPPTSFSFYYKFGQFVLPLHSHLTSRLVWENVFLNLVEEHFTRRGNRCSISISFSRTPKVKTQGWAVYECNEYNGCLDEGDSSAWEAVVEHRASNYKKAAVLISNKIFGKVICTRKPRHCF